MAFSRRVVVTGVSAISPLGLDAETTWAALLEGRSGVGPITQFDTEGFTSRIAAEVKDFDPEQWTDFKTIKKTDRFAHFAIAATRMAIDDAGLDLEAVDLERFGVVVGSGIGGLHTLVAEHEKLLKRGPRRVSPYLIPAMIINMASGIVSIEFGLKGPNHATVTACATGNHAIGDAMRMIQHGDADVMVAGGSEGVISPLAVAGFCAIKALSTRNDDPERASRPFDVDRDGFIFGEGCGLLILESEEHAKKRGARILAELVGFGMSGDAFHVSAPPEDGDGMIRVMRAALGDADMAASEIDYINAHGTSTPTGDAIEARAVRGVFGEHADVLHVSSTKSMTGHLLGAAGGLEAVVTVLALDRDRIPPTANLENLDPEIAGEGIGMSIDRFVPQKAIEKRVGAALTNSFGFGGTNASLIFKTYEG